MMRRSKRLAGIITVGSMLLVAAACGQRPGVAEDFSGVAGNVNPLTGQLINPSATAGADGSFDLGDGGTGSGDLGGTGSGDIGGTGSGDVGGGETGGGEGGGGTPEGPNPPGAPTGGSTVGITAETIKIGIHAPLTGAAPVPSDSFDKGKDLYYKWAESLGEDIFGRGVEVVVKNDNYNPSQAVAVCKEMVEKEKVFLLIGGAGTDQIQACARYAASVGVPYLSAGVTEVGLTGLPNYFASSMSYPEQGPLLADFLVSELGGKAEKNGMLRFNTPNFQDAHDAFVRGMSEQGAELAYDRSVPKEANTADATAVVQEMSAAGLKNVYVLTSPVWFLQVLRAAAQQNYRPQWIGVGITMTFDTIAAAGCGFNQNIDGAKFFAPFPAWIQSNQFDPDFRKAVQKFYPQKNGGDDFMWALWSTGKGLWDLLALPGENLTRERFMWFLERVRGFKNGIGPELNYSPDDHFGANQVHVQQAQCSDRRWHTIKSFVSDF
jgi:ABC-type branched-subunit amino acid transport system substrate-binding protein